VTLTERVRLRSSRSDESFSDSVDSPLVYIVASAVRYEMGSYAVLAPRTGGSRPGPTYTVQSGDGGRWLKGARASRVEARPTAAAVAAWLVAGTGERGKTPPIPSVYKVAQRVQPQEAGPPINGTRIIDKELSRRVLASLGSKSPGMMTSA
jgi:hypothetical protein